MTFAKDDDSTDNEEESGVGHAAAAWKHKGRKEAGNTTRTPSLLSTEQEPQAKPEEPRDKPELPPREEAEEPRAKPDLPPRGAARKYHSDIGPTRCVSGDLNLTLTLTLTLHLTC